jgi:transposase, IS6 family
MRTRRPRLAPASRSAFVGFRFPSDVIVVAVRWYLRFGLSYRDVEELLAERGIEVDHVTIYRWVQRFTPLLAEAARVRPIEARPFGVARRQDAGGPAGGGAGAAPGPRTLAG